MRKLTMPELNRLDIDDYHKVTKIPAIIVLDNVRSLSNVGSFFRTADAFRIEAIFLCGITATPPHREIHKTALGARRARQPVLYQQYRRYRKSRHHHSARHESNPRRFIRIAQKRCCPSNSKGTSQREDRHRHLWRLSDVGAIGARSSCRGRQHSATTRTRPSRHHNRDVARKDHTADGFHFQR